MTVKDLKVGDLLSPNRRVYHVEDIGSGYRHLVIEKTDQGGVVYTTYLPSDTSLEDAYGGGSYKEDEHLS